MSLNPEEISKLIKQQIKRYDEELEIDETGTIITVGDTDYRMQWRESFWNSPVIYTVW